MHGPQILARFLSERGPADKYGQEWQYNSRSDRHSKAGCWGVAFDLLTESQLMQAHARADKIVLGVNHVMRDFQNDREKVLDLVVARPAGSVADDASTLRRLVDHYRIPLSEAERALLESLPDIKIAPVGAVLVALEAKATMTKHVAALPRLHDELNSSHLAIHGASSQAIAIAYVQINNSSTFLSSVANSERISEGLSPRVSKHKQPKDTEAVLKKVAQLPRRSNKQEVGFDAIGVTVLDMANDGTPVKLVEGLPAPQPGSNFHYASMIVRMANEYDTTFTHI